MEFNGEIVFAVSDNEKKVEVDFGTEIFPTKIINKGDIIALGKTAPKNRWIHRVKYNGEKDYIEKLELVLNQLYEKKEYIDKLIKLYEQVELTIYIRSEFGQIGYTLPHYVIQKMALLKCDFSFDILSFGMVLDE